MTTIHETAARLDRRLSRMMCPSGAGMAVSPALALGMFVWLLAHG